MLALKQKIGSISETLSVPLVRGALAPPSWHRLFSRAIGTAAQRARPDHNSTKGSYESMVSNPLIRAERPTNLSHP